jgi:hypothetical protein
MLTISVRRFLPARDTVSSALRLRSSVSDSEMGASFVPAPAMGRLEELAPLASVRGRTAEAEIDLEISYKGSLLRGLAGDLVGCQTSQTFRYGVYVLVTQQLYVSLRDVEAFLLGLCERRPLVDSEVGIVDEGILQVVPVRLSLYIELAW